MAGSQIATSVTILNSLKGFQAISLTEYNTSAAASIAAGSVVEIAGAYFTFLTDEAINAASWTAIVTGTTAYITLTASGAPPAQIVDVAYTATAPVWRDDLQGWYASAASNVRVIGSVYKAEATSYTEKYIFPANEQKGFNPLVYPHGKKLFISAGTFIVPWDVNTVYLTGCGAGGNGGAGNGTYGGGGGGSGAIWWNEPKSVTPGSVLSVTVSPVTFGSYSLNSGSNGSVGGAAGAGGALGDASIAGAAGGIGTSGVAAAAGGSSGYAGGGAGGGLSGGGGGGGGLGVWIRAVLGTAGVGGAAAGANGGGGGGGTAAGGVGGNGGAGSGGGGGSYLGSPAGGTGGPGIVIVEW
jgi:hypothetical protein